MKKIAIAVSAALLGAQLTAQAVELTTQEQKFSYAIGAQMAQNLKAQNLKIDSQAFSAAVKDVLEGGSMQLTPEQMTQAMNEARKSMAAEHQAKADAALAAGKKFLEANKSKPGVHTLPSGLQYEELKAGSGETPPKNATVTVHYEGKLIDGTVFDSSIKRGQPATFPLNGVIPGFREALSNMKTGAKWRVFIPSELGYGEHGAGASIGPNETLIFDIELISFKAG